MLQKVDKIINLTHIRLISVSISTMDTIILNLDESKSINDICHGINADNMSSTIYLIIDLVKKFGKNIGVIYQDAIQLKQCQIPVTYLNITIPIVFEFDDSHQFINIVFYNHNQSKTYLKLFLSIIDEPTIKYIENDHSGVVPSYSDEKIKLKPGEYLINFSHCFMSYIGFKRVRLDDDSYLVTKKSIDDDKEMRTKLWLYSLVSKGRSWYAKFGYEPGNSNIHEYDLLVSDVRNINLGEVSMRLSKLISAPNKDDFDPALLDFSSSLVKIIGSFNKSLREYTIEHTLEEFTVLTNILTQSIFGKKIYILADSSLSKNTNDDIDLSQYSILEFPWYDQYKKLLIANIIQVNNNIMNYFYHLPK